MNMPAGMDMNMHKEMMMRYHWEMYMNCKIMMECYEKMHQHNMMMSQYHQQMYMHYCNGDTMPQMPGMQCPPAK